LQADPQSAKLYLEHRWDLAGQRCFAIRILDKENRKRPIANPVVDYIMRKFCASLGRNNRNNGEY